jgi:FkbM family methyltransferase
MQRRRTIFQTLSSGLVVITDNFMFSIRSPTVWYALLSWPKFSMTSYRMVSSLIRQGIIPKAIIDVGANVGQFAVACAKIFPSVAVHSFEPLPHCLKQLDRNVTGLGGVRVYPVALGEQDGEVTMHVNSHSHSSSILGLGERHRKAFPDAREIGTIRVPVSTLDRELESVSLENPVLLKLDVQGYEPQVLNGATETLKRVDYVLLETSFRPLYEGEKTFTEIARTMEERGFEFLRPVAWLSDPHNGEVLQMDALFARAAGRS